MENKLSSENYYPEDEYPALDAQPIEAAEPVIPARETEAAEPAEPVIPARETEAAEPAPAYPYTAPAPRDAVPAEAVSIPPAPQPTAPAPYMPYPMQGMPYPIQQMPPQTPVYPGYPVYYMPYPPQQSPMPQPIQPAVQAPVPQPQQSPVQQPISQAPSAVPQQNAAPAQNQPYTIPEASNQKKPTSTGTKVFLIILIALLFAMVSGFIVYIANAADRDKAKSADQNSDPFSIGDNDDDPFEIIPGDDGDTELERSEFEEKITLVADDGATQKRDNDNPDSIGTPDKNAKGIEFKSLPKDKDDTSKYTAKSSFNTLNDSVVTVSCYQGEITENIYDIASSGSGTIISSDGYIITNAHVLNNSKMYAVSVMLNNGDKYQAKIVGYDTWTDLAVLKIDAKNLTPAVFTDSDSVEVGDSVIAIGSPGGAKFQNSLTQGVVSAVDREISVNKFVRYIQSDATINPGSSGGPLCNLYGQVIGITTAKTVAENYENMSFSIPSAVVKDVAADLIRYGYIPDRARIGFSGTEVTADDKLYYGMPAGVIVGEISDDGALAGTKIRQYDVITAIDGEPIASFQDIYNILARHKKGDKVTLSVYRIEDKEFFETIEESE